MSGLSSQVKKTKPRRDITKINLPKPTSKPKAASGTISKKVGTGKAVKQTEATRPQARGRIMGENTAPRGKGPKATL